MNFSCFYMFCPPKVTFGELFCTKIRLCFLSGTFTFCDIHNTCCMWVSLAPSPECTRQNVGFALFRKAKNTMYLISIVVAVPPGGPGLHRMRSNIAIYIYSLI